MSSTAKVSFSSKNSAAREFYEANFEPINKAYADVPNQITTWKERKVEVIESTKASELEAFNKEFKVFMTYKETIEKLDKMVALIDDAIELSNRPPLDPVTLESIELLPIDVTSIKMRFQKETVENRDDFIRLKEEKINPLRENYIARFQEARWALEPWAKAVLEKNQKSMIKNTAKFVVAYLTNTTEYVNRAMTNFEKKEEKNG